MEKIILKSRKEEWMLEEFEVKYLFSCLQRFDYKNNLNLFISKKIVLTPILVVRLYDCLKKELIILLNDCYSKPPNRKIQKHPTYYERFTFENNKYVVNYTTSVIERLMYTLFLRLSFLEKSKNSNEVVELVIF